MTPARPGNERERETQVVIDYAHSVPRRSDPISGYIAFNAIISSCGALTWIIPLARNSLLNVFNESIVASVWIVVILASTLGALCACGIVAHEWLILKQFDRWVFLTLLCGLVAASPAIVVVGAGIVTLAFH